MRELPSKRVLAAALELWIRPPRFRHHEPPRFWGLRSLPTALERTMAPGTRMALDAGLGSRTRRGVTRPAGAARAGQTAAVVAVGRYGIGPASDGPPRRYGSPAGGPRHGGCRITEAGRAPVQHSCGLAAPQPPMAARAVGDGRAGCAGALPR